jgi:membrane protein DedA with SNARE-associated domain
MDMFPDSYPLAVYISVFFGPFVQEDAAVLYAAGLAVNGVNQWLPLYFTILAGLFFSDIWKYWIGWAALKHPRARGYAEREHVADMGGKVQDNLLKTLLIGRFVPLARVPTYLACGYFKISYLKFCLGIALTAALYVSTVFTVVHFLGEIVGERLKWILPLFALLVLAVMGGAYLLRRGKTPK